uniref:Uncharacterized protein n=2 Tax=Tetraselmis chuii TaxID=63592 RepID=A0A7S1SQN6_9CHLO
MLTATNLEAIRSGRSRGAASSAAALMSVGSYADDNDSLSEFMSLSSGSFSPTGIREPPGIEIPVYDGVLPVTRKGDDNIPGMHPNMGPVLREVLRDQAKSKPFKRGDLKVPPPARHAARPTRIVGGMNLPASLDDIIDPRRIQDRPRESLYLPEPYHPDKTWVPQDLDDVVLQGEAFKESNLAASVRGDELALAASEGMAQLSVADTGGKPQHHLLALATMTPGVTEARVVQAARGGPLPIPGVPYGEDPARPVPYAMEKVVHGMQKVAKGWMQKKEYKRQRAAGKIQAFVRGRWDRMRVAKMRAEMGLPPLGAKYVRRTARNKKRYEDKRTRDLRTAYHRQVAGIVPAMELEKATEQPRYSAGGKTPTRNPY